MEAESSPSLLLAVQKVLFRNTVAFKNTSINWKMFSTNKV